MEDVTNSDGDARGRRRLVIAVKGSLDELHNQLSMFNRQVSARLELKDIDLDCLDLIHRAGPLSPTALARRSGLHPATMTGILDRLERSGWIGRERDPADRRATIIRARSDRNAELFQLLSGMNSSMDQICADYTDAQLELLADFMRRTINAGRDAAGELAGE
jgi:DNA-binding MarR family transcriptional regulator